MGTQKIHGIKNVGIDLVATQKAGDRGSIDGLIDSLKQAEAEFNVKTRFIEALDPVTYETTFRTLANRGTDIIITTIFAMGANVEMPAPEFPHKQFFVVAAAPFAAPVPNARGWIQDVRKRLP